MPVTPFTLLNGRQITDPENQVPTAVDCTPYQCGLDSGNGQAKFWCSYHGFVGAKVCGDPSCTPYATQMTWCSPQQFQALPTPVSPPPSVYLAPTPPYPKAFIPRDTSVDECFRHPVNTNEYDQCLQQDFYMWQWLVAGGKLRPKHCHRDNPIAQYVEMPKEGRKFAPASTLPVSSAIPFTGVDLAVLTTRVPYGYDGIVEEIVCGMVSTSGATFTEGSGDVAFRLSADYRFLRDQGNLTLSTGSIREQGQMRGNWKVYSGNLLKFVVNFAIGAESRVNPDARVVCAIRGYFYPR